MADKAIHTGSHFFKFRSLRNKLLILIIVLSLLPLIGISIFSYNAGSKQISKDRIRLLLENKAQDTADKIDIMLRNQKQEVNSMATTFWRTFPGLGTQNHAAMVQMLNDFTVSHEVYDILVVVDKSGRIVAVNTVNRLSQPLGSAALLGQGLKGAEEKELFNRSIRGASTHHDWYRSSVVQHLYDYSDRDISYWYNIAYGEPLLDPVTHETVGAWISIINWSYIQNILDSVEPDLSVQDLKTGYAFMYAKDADTIIGHKYRANRKDLAPLPNYPAAKQDLYGTRVVGDHGLKDLHDAVLRQNRSVFNFAYEFPKGTRKLSGLAFIDDAAFGWIVGVGVDEVDIFRPIRTLSWWIVAATLILAALVVVMTYLVAQGITIPLKNLIHTAQSIAQGNLKERVQVRSSDEVGILGSTFNDMARALETRETQLQELNRNLESMVRQRTQELEGSHDALKQAYLDLQNTQEQLVHTEKMASLGQLVAGIAHEIKNPLNFIYGNTAFLSDYTKKLQLLLEAFDSLPSLSPEDRARIDNLKKDCNYAFIGEDLPTLINNFTEGAGRINTIVSDLRTFSRMDSYMMAEIDVHASIEISLNLLRNQYKERIAIHREYGAIPKIQGYAGKLSQVFMNLLTNAFHAIGEKGDVWIRTRAVGGMIEVEVQDNGQGIPRENLKRIFEPFFTTKAVGQGTGLGLSISYGIIEQHHGRILVANAPGGGTIFTVRLPIEQEKSAS
jgi:signal transduction histidine kinase